MGIPVIYLIDTAMNRRDEDEGRLFSMLLLLLLFLLVVLRLVSSHSVHICAIFLSGS